MDFAPVQREHIEKALADLDAGASPAGFRDSTTYDVIHQGRPYPPKQLIALALKHATRPNTGSGRYSSGTDTKYVNKVQIWYQVDLVTA
jgi:hypothetical protein